MTHQELKDINYKLGIDVKARRKAIDKVTGKFPAPRFTLVNTTENKYSLEGGLRETFRVHDRKDGNSHCLYVFTRFVPSGEKAFGYII